MPEERRLRPPGWRIVLVLCALWNVIYATVSAVTQSPVFVIYLVPSYFFLPVYAWLVWGLWEEKYAAWMVGLLACAPFVLRGISTVIAVLIHGHGTIILPMESRLQILGVCAIATNVLMGILLLAYRDEFSPD